MKANESTFVRLAVFAALRRVGEVIGAAVFLAFAALAAPTNLSPNTTAADPVTDKDETIVLAPGSSTNLTTVAAATSWNAKVSSTSVVTVQVSRNADGTAKISLRGGTISDATQKLTAAEVLSQNRATVEIRSGSAMSGQGTLVKTITVNLGEAIRLKSGESVQRAKSYTSGRRWAVACEQDGSFVDVALDKTSEAYSQYGYCLRTAADATGATLTMTGRDVGTETVVFGRQYETSSKKEAPKVMAIYYVTVYDDKSTPIAVPTAAQGLVYGWTNQVGVAEGEGYVLSGVSVTNAPGTFTAFATPDDGYCWTDKSRATKEISWSIAYREATVTVIDTNKVTGAAEPVYRTRNEGFIADDPTKLVWTAWRTNMSEEVGTYDIVVLGETRQGGYAITYVGGTLEITAEPVGPTIPEDEGEIEYDPATKEVIVTPKDETVTEVEIINMPADGTVKVPVTVGMIRGVAAEQVAEVFYTAPAGAGGTTYDITPAFAISGDKAGGVTIELKETASVTFDLGDGKAETVTVTPTLTETGDEAVEPFEVATDEVDVGVKTIPGLTYELRRSDEPGTVRAGKVVNERRAEGLRTKLTDPMDGGKPEKAFYIIEVKK